MDDFQKCLQLFIHVFNGEPWYDKWTDDTAFNYLQELVDNKRFLGYTLWDNGKLAGAVFAHMKSHYKGDEIFVDELFVSPDCQRSGCGMALMGAVDKFAKENFIISITLLTGLGKPSFQFFSKFGCKHLDYLAFMYKRMV
jgi:GNAT superfamily N-acetyltransferase